MPVVTSEMGCGADNVLLVADGSNVALEDMISKEVVSV